MLDEDGHKAGYSELVAKSKSNLDTKDNSEKPKMPTEGHYKTIAFISFLEKGEAKEALKMIREHNFVPGKNVNFDSLDHLYSSDQHYGNSVISMVIWYLQNEVFSDDGDEYFVHKIDLLEELIVDLIKLQCDGRWKKDPKKLMNEKPSFLLRLMQILSFHHESRDRFGYLLDLSVKHGVVDIQSELDQFGDPAIYSHLFDTTELQNGSKDDEIEQLRNLQAYYPELNSRIGLHPTSLYEFCDVKDASQYDEYLIELAGLLKKSDNLAWYVENLLTNRPDMENLILKYFEGRDNDENFRLVQSIIVSEGLKGAASPKRSRVLL